MGPLRSLCPRTQVTLRREVGLSWDLLCKMIIEKSLKQLEANTIMTEPSLGSTSEPKGR